MERLWSPWRSKYISSFSTTPKAESNSCFLCDAVAAKLSESSDEDRTLTPDAQNLVVYRAKLCFVIMNRYPYNAGHLMVVPNEHCGDFAQLSAETTAEMMHILQLCNRVLTELYHPHGYNIGANLGRVAGAGVPDHVHFHIVPRWSGDTNFMPVLADVRVASESLETSYAEIHAKFAAVAERE